MFVFFFRLSFDDTQLIILRNNSNPFLTSFLLFSLFINIEHNPIANISNGAGRLLPFNSYPISKSIFNIFIINLYPFLISNHDLSLKKYSFDILKLKRNISDCLRYR